MLDSIQQAVVAWWPNDERIAYANQFARDHGLGDNPIERDVVRAAVDHRYLRTSLEKHGCTAPPVRLSFRGDVWFLRTVGLDDRIELLALTRQRLREIEMVRALQIRFRLTDRQADVLRHLLRAQPTQAIAGALDISVATVRRHVSDLLEALGVDSRLAVVVLASRLQPQ
jgi:DNA-binding CsgD family transcriptional regulator